MITIKNLRTEQMHDAWDVRVDRASVLGNPFLMRNESERNSVCDEYAEYFDAIVTNNLSKLRNWGVTSTEREQFMTELRRLYKICKQYGRLNLYCWCAPKRCHAETIRNFLMGYLEPADTAHTYLIKYWQDFQDSAHSAGGNWNYEQFVGTKDELAQKKRELYENACDNVTVTFIS